MRINIDVVQQPPHALNRADIKALLGVVPPHWLNYIKVIHLCATLPKNSCFDRPVIYSHFSGRLNVCCRGLKPNEARKEILRELAVKGLGIRSYYGHVLSAQQLKQVDKAVNPLLALLLSEATGRTGIEQVELRMTNTTTLQFEKAKCEACGNLFRLWADSLNGCCARCGRAFPQKFKWVQEKAIQEQARLLFLQNEEHDRQPVVCLFCPRCAGKLIREDDHLHCEATGSGQLSKSVETALTDAIKTTPVQPVLSLQGLPLSPRWFCPRCRHPMVNTSGLTMQCPECSLTLTGGLIHRLVETCPHA